MTRLNAIGAIVSPIQIPLLRPPEVLVVAGANGLLEGLWFDDFIVWLDDCGVCCIVWLDDWIVIPSAF